MTFYVVSPQGQQDVLDIVEYIAADNLDAAFRLRDRLFASFDRLAAQPGLGHMREDLSARESGVRFWRVGTYIVIYRHAASRTEIVRVLSGYRDIRAVLGGSTE